MLGSGNRLQDIMIYVDECEPVGEVESQFGHRKVTFKRNKDVRNVFDMINEIGRGKFGRVMKCRKKDNGEIFAAKFVTCTRREDRRNVEREVEIMNNLKSHKLLQLFEAYDNGRSEMCLITEYIGGGELFDRVIEDEFVLSEKACCIFTKQILEGVSYIHRQQIIHLDLKPENILCLTRSGNRVKIIDFGLARKFEPMKKLQILFGTPEFVAPEVVNFEPIGYSTDMWALGVITYVLVSGLSPFMGDTDLETMANVTIAEYDYEDEAFDNVSEHAKDFIDSLLVKGQSKRASAEACLSHPWLQTTSSVEQAGEANQGKRLNIAKDNLNQQKTAWNNRDSNYYLFDSKSRTASQLYEMNLSLSPRVLDMSGCKEEETDSDQFSFFMPDGTVRSDSDLLVTPEGKVTSKDSHEQINETITVNEGLRKRSLEDVRPKRGKEETIEYQGLVKRPKTPLITAGDIAKQAASLCERKASACGSLPDVVSSSTLENTELHASRCSLVEDIQLPVDILEKEPSIICSDISGKQKDDLPLPDIVNGEEDCTSMAPAEGLTSQVETDGDPESVVSVPPIVIEDLGPCLESSGSLSYINGDTLRSDPSPIVSSPCPGETDTYDIHEWGQTDSTGPEIVDEDEADMVVSPDSDRSEKLMSPEIVISGKDRQISKEDIVISSCPVTKNYTVEEGFDRPSDGWGDMHYSKVVDDVVEENCDISDAESEESDEKSSSSSSLPSESSGIFYKAEYTPPDIDSPTVPSLLSVENRDTYWRSFFSKNVGRSGEKTFQSGLKKSSSGCSKQLNEHDKRILPCKSKSDAAINYNPPTSCSAVSEEYSEPEINSNGKSNESCLPQELLPDENRAEQIVVPRSLKSSCMEEEVFNKPWTETAGSSSPEQGESQDQLSSTISQEMQDLLSSIQSLGGQESKSTFSAQGNSGIVPYRHRKDGTQENTVDMDRLLREVEDHIRFSATAELLDRIAKCPSIESISQVAREMEVKGQKKVSLPAQQTSNYSTANTSVSPRSTPPQFSQTLKEYNNTSYDCNGHVGSPILPDLVQPAYSTVQDDKIFSNTTSTTPGDSQPSSSITSPSPEPITKKRFTSLPRPSEMPSSPQVRTPVQVPDMLARVNCNSTNSDWKSEFKGQNEVNNQSHKGPNQTSDATKNFCSGNVNYNNYINVCEDLSQVRNNIDNLRDIISSTKSDIKNNSKPLLDIFEKCHFYTHASPGPEGITEIVSSTQALKNDLMETNNAMKEIEKTVSNFSRHVSLPSGKIEPRSNPNPRKIFSGARQGSVTKTKDKYEQQSIESRIPLPLHGQKQRCTTPFSKTRSSSPAVQDMSLKRRNLSITPQTECLENNISFRGRTGTGSKMSLRKRSPSPVVTGKVSSFRNKFENIPVKNNNHASTMPRTYRLKSKEPADVIGQKSCLIQDASSSKLPQLSPGTSSDSSRRLNSLSKQTSASRLPAHFVSLTQLESDASCNSHLSNNCALHSSGNSRPNLGRTQSVRNPRFSVGSQGGDTTATKNAVNFLRATLPRKSLPETSPSDSSRLCGPFGYNRL